VARSDARPTDQFEAELLDETGVKGVKAIVVPAGARG
jgi:hypothetical protein